MKIWISADIVDAHMNPRLIHELNLGLYIATVNFESKAHYQKFKS